MGYIHPVVSEICDPQSLDPICGKFDKFLAHGQTHTVQMGKWPWQCTTRGLNNNTKLWMEKIRQAVTEIWVPQVWQPPARPPARTVTTIPLQPGGLRGKKLIPKAGLTPLSVYTTAGKDEIIEAALSHHRRFSSPDFTADENFTLLYPSLK